MTFRSFPARGRYASHLTACANAPSAIHCVDDPFPAEAREDLEIADA